MPISSRLIRYSYAAVSAENRLLSISPRKTACICRSLSTTAVEDPSSVSISPIDGHTAYAHSTLPHGCIDYARGWAWQQFLLSRRLSHRRSLAADPSSISPLAKKKNNNNNNNNNHDEQAQAVDTDIVLLFEHTPVYTLGRGADENHLTFLQKEENSAIREKLSRKNRGIGSARLSVDRRLLEDDLMHRSDQEAVDILSRIASPVIAPRDVPIFRIERGGEVTFHGPGQLVVYPLLDLQREPYKQDLHWYLRMVEQVVILTLQHYNIDGVRDEINTGVWVGENKVAAVGVSSSRWITTHGFALNVYPDLSYFDTSVILPCGIDGKGVTSIAEVLKERAGDAAKVPSVEDVATVVLQSIQDVFGIEIKTGKSLR
jgi:lipoyl(octanoyl) transferase